MNKKDRILAWSKELVPAAGTEFDRCYGGYFICFNAGRYYEAHDVLEHLWLGCDDGNRRFYQGLIQIAGAFVHLQKQHARPDHPKDGRRLRPAVRLFDLAMANLTPYRPRHLRLDVDRLFSICTSIQAEILASDYTRNPWQPGQGPVLELRDTA